MSKAGATSLAGNAEVRQVREFLRFVDALNSHTILDEDQVDRLGRDLASFRFFAKRQINIYERGGSTGSRHRQEAARQRSRAHDEYQRMVSTHDERRVILDDLEARLVHYSARRLEADVELREAREEYSRTAERYDENQHLRWSPVTAGFGVSDSYMASLRGRVRRAEVQRREALEEERSIADEVENARAECAGLKGMLDETLDRLKHSDEFVARVGTVTRNASEDAAVAWAAHSSSADLYSFVRARQDADQEVGVDEFMAQLNYPLDAVSDDDPGPMTRRTALERLAALAEADDAE